MQSAALTSVLVADGDQLLGNVTYACLPACRRRVETQDN